MKKSLSVLLLLVLLLSVACTPQASTGGDSTAALPEVGVTIYKFDDNFMSFVRGAIQREAEGKLTLNLVDSANDQAKQNEQVDGFIQKGVKVLAINLVDPQAAGAVIEKAKAASLPVVFYNKEPDKAAIDSYDKAWYVGTRSAESGEIQGQMIVDAWKANAEWDKNGDGVMQYVLLKGEPGHPDAEARTQYAVETVVNAGIKVKELELQTGMWDTAKAKDLMDTWISKHGDAIEMVIANNDAMALGALTSLEGAGYMVEGKFIPIVGVDAIPDALAKIEEGKLVGSVLNDAGNQGKAVVDLSVNLAAGKDPLDGTSWKLDEAKAVRVPYKAITIDNLDDAKASYGQ